MVTRRFLIIRITETRDFSTIALCKILENVRGENRSVNRLMQLLDCAARRCGTSVSHRFVGTVSRSIGHRRRRRRSRRRVLPNETVSQCRKSNRGFSRRWAHRTRRISPWPVWAVAASTLLYTVFLANEMWKWEFTQTRKKVFQKYKFQFFFLKFTWDFRNDFHLLIASSPFPYTACRRGKIERTICSISIT